MKIEQLGQLNIRRTKASGSICSGEYMGEKQWKNKEIKEKIIKECDQWNYFGLSFNKEGTDNMEITSRDEKKKNKTTNRKPMEHGRGK